MILDGVPASTLLENTGPAGRATAAFLRFIEQRLGVSIVRNGRYLPSDPSLIAPMALARLLHARGIIKEYGRSTTELPDEPRLMGWYAICDQSNEHKVGGTTWESDADALYATLAEALERYIWFGEVDYFVSPTRATIAGIAKKGRVVVPHEFAGYSEASRRANPSRQLREDAEYLWIRGESLTHGDKVFLPAQIVSGAREHASWERSKEPVIRWTTTNGLATSPTLVGARLAGALEVIEREAYMSMWLNQLTLPQLSLASLCACDASLARSIAACERYRLKVHVLQMPTDAPTHAVAVVVEDMSGVAPRFALGLRAHRSLPRAIQKALTEALRARRGYRLWVAEGNTWDPATPIEAIGHRERLYYWGDARNAHGLEFLVRGPEVEAEARPWESDDEKQHLSRVVDWCRAADIESVSFSLGRSAKNPTPWHIEMVVMPALQPTYLTEGTRAFGGERWRSVPKALGYPVRDEPFAGAPHPFS